MMPHGIVYYKISTFNFVQVHYLQGIKLLHLYPIQISWYLTKIVHENQRKFQKKCFWG